MVERGQKLGFAFEAGKAVGVFGELVGKNLDGDFAPEFRITRTPDFTHAASSQRGDDFVVGESGSGFDHVCIGLSQRRVVNRKVRSVVRAVETP